MKHSLFITQSAICGQHSRIALFNEIYKNLRERDIDFTIASFREQDPECPKPAALLPDVYPGAMDWPLIKRIKHLNAVKDRFAFDHYLIGGYGHPETWWMWRQARRRKIPMTLWTGGGVHTESSGHPLVRMLKRRFVRKVGNFVTYGTSARRFLQALGVPAGAIRTGVNVSDTAFFRDASVEHKKTPEYQKAIQGHPHPILLFSGELSDRKGIVPLLACLRGLQERNYFLYVLGKGKHEATVREAFSSGAVPGRYFGHLDREDMARRMAEADVYITPTFHDPFSRTLSEALACGCYALVSIFDDAGHDLIRHKINGQLFHPGNPEHFTAVLGGVLKRQWPDPKQAAVSAALKYDTAHYGRQIADAIIEAMQGVARK